MNDLENLYVISHLGAIAKTIHISHILSIVKALKIKIIL